MFLPPASRERGGIEGEGGEIDPGMMGGGLSEIMEEQGIEAGITAGASHEGQGDMGLIVNMTDNQHQPHHQVSDTLPRSCSCACTERVPGLHFIYFDSVSS